MINSLTKGSPNELHQKRRDVVARDLFDPRWTGIVGWLCDPERPHGNFSCRRGNFYLDWAIARRFVSDRLGLVEATVIDGQSSSLAFALVVNLNEAMAKLHIAPTVILLGLYFRSDNRVDSDDRDKKESAFGLQCLYCRAIERTVLVNLMSQSQRRRKNGKLIEMQLQIVKISKIA